MFTKVFLPICFFRQDIPAVEKIHASFVFFSTTFVIFITLYCKFMRGEMRFG